MENVFNYNPSTDELSKIGIEDTSEKEYIARITKEDSNKVKMQTLFDLSHYFSLKGNRAELERIDKELSSAGVFENGFNE